MDDKQRKEQVEELDPLRRGMKEAAAERPDDSAGNLHFGARSPDGRPSAADEAVDRAASGWAVRDESEEEIHGAAPNEPDKGS